jgi:hypothetical protein
MVVLNGGLLPCVPKSGCVAVPRAVTVLRAHPRFFVRHDHERDGEHAMKTQPAIAALVTLMALATGIVAAQQANTGRCDRACLNAMVDSYLAAVVAHDASRTSIAPSAKFVENLTARKPGEGLWQTASAGPTTFKIYVPDPASGQVGFMGVMQEDGTPIQIALRLKVQGGQITEIEHLVARNLGERNLGNLTSPRPGLLTTVAEAQRAPREQLLEIGASYYDALDDNNGKAAPFADDCVRHENGMQTSTNRQPAAPGGMAALSVLGCAAQIDTGTFAYIDTIDRRRVEIADVETGLVFGLSHFHHSMTQKFVTIKGVQGVEKVDLNINAFDFPAAHIYKVVGGKIHEIEAMGFTAPYNSRTGWE